MRLVALVDVDASLGNVGGKESPALFANAKGFVAFWFTVGVRAAPDIFAWRFARQSWWCSDKAGIALTLVRAGDVLAVGSVSANIWIASALVDVQTNIS